MSLFFQRVSPGVPEWGSGPLMMVTGVDFSEGFNTRLDAEINAPARTITTNAAVTLAYLVGRLGIELLLPQERHVFSGGEGGLPRTMGDFRPATWEIPVAQRTNGASTVAEVIGEVTNRPFLREHSPYALDLPGEDKTRILWALAGASYLFEMRRFRRVVSSRPAGFPAVAVGAGVVVLGVYLVNELLSSWVETTAIEADRDVRIASLRYAEAAHEYDARIKAWFNSGDGTPARPRTMPPPGEAERAIHADVVRRGESFWNELGRSVGEGAKTGVKWAAVAAVVAAVALAASSSRGK